MRPRTRDDFAIAIICALPLEAEAVEALFDETYDRLGKHYGKQRGDANAYINGRIGKHDVVLCYMPGMGKGSAAGVASSLLVSYAGVRLALVVGICGGAPPPPEYQEIFLGDVIISDSVIEYDFGQQYPGGFQRKTGVKDTLGRPAREIRGLLNGVRAENARRELQDQAQQYLHALQQTGAKWHHPGVSDVLFKARYLHKHYSHASAGCSCFRSDAPDQICEEALGMDCNELDCDLGQQVRCREASEAVPTSIYIGPIASADTVMKSGQHRDGIFKREKVIGFEMEGAGVWDNVPCIIIKGVCDYADSHKSKVWQAYAAATGASAAKAFLEYWMPANHKDMSKKRHLMIPFARNPRFVGRQEEIQAIEDLISIPDGPKMLAITGLGGVGKTQIALELAYRLRDREPECSIFWIPCTSHEAVEQACMTIAQLVGNRDVRPSDIKDCIKAYLSQTDMKWFLIFDNADDSEMWMQTSGTASALREFLPYNIQGHILFTTRNLKLAVKLASSDVICVRELDENSGVEFLRASLIQKSLLNDHHAVVTLLDQLTFLPLAITQAAAYINGNSIRISDYLLLLQEQEADVVELLSEDFGDDRRYKDMQNPIAMTWLISFRQINDFDPLASEYLSLMACVNPRNIPESFLPRSASKKKKTDALGLLSAYSFITIQLGNGSINLHRLVHLSTRNWIKNEKQFPIYIKKAADRLSSIFPCHDHTNRQLWRELLPHAMFLMSDDEFRKQEEQYVDYIHDVGTCLDSDGRYSEAETLLARVLEIRKRVFGSQNPHTILSMSYLALTYNHQGQWKEAEKLFVRAMDILRQAQGPEHCNTLTTMNNLALTYGNQGKLKEAEELLVQVMKTFIQVLGLENLSTLTAMANLALTYHGQGKWKKAEELEVQVLKAREQMLGPEHQDTLTSMANLATTYHSHGRWKRSKELAVQAIETQKRVLGPEHPDTLTSINILASNYTRLGRWKEAEKLLVHIIEIQKQALGPEHPDTLTTMAGLASTYHLQGKWKDAEDLNVKVMKSSKQVLGPKHPRTLTSMNSLAWTYKDQGRWNEAARLLWLVTEIKKQALGPEHPDTLTSMANLALAYRNQGKLEKAEELGMQVMVTQKQMLGTEHPDTLTSTNNLAVTYRNQGRLKKAERLGIQVMEMSRQVLGPEHPNTLTSMANLTATYHSQGRWKEAGELAVWIIEAQKQVLGPEHPDTLKTINNLALTYRCQGRRKEAERLEIQILNTRKQMLVSEHPGTHNQLGRPSIDRQASKTTE